MRMSPASRHSGFILLAALLPFVYFQKSVTGQQCRGYWYDTRRYMCCADYELCLRGTRILHDCCGKHCYSEGNSICCSGRLVDKCSQFHASCCGYRCYKADMELCCDGVIVKRCAKNAECCGTECIDARRFICCEGRVLPRCAPGDSAACCGDRCYDKTQQICDL
uniref:Galaxin-like repeats domain-containing protein n=1 Tax=Trichuris muris TaxID=70415 RepID=A0A5S6QAX8_TRIMR